VNEQGSRQHEIHDWRLPVQEQTDLETLFDDRIDVNSNMALHAISGATMYSIVILPSVNAFLTTTETSKGEYDMDTIDEAFSVINDLKELSLPSRPQYLHPYLVLTALLQHAPSVAGKTELARDILADTEDDPITRLTKLTDYYFCNLLVACTSSPFISFLTVLVRSQGGKTPTPSDHPSRRGESLDFRAVNGRLNQREKVATHSDISHTRLFVGVVIVVLSAVNMMH
jgi:hypothetical protein